MEWLSQNWIWILAFIAVLWFFARRGHGGIMGCGGMAHEGAQEAGKPQAGDTPPSPMKGASVQDKQDAPAAQRHKGGCC